MDFLKTAVASAISKGPTFPYIFGDRVDIDQSIWTLHNGTKRDDGSKCSIFSFDVNTNATRLPLARNCLRKLRTIRHPGVIKILDTVETDAYIYIATERLTPLGWHTRRKSLAEETLKWGLHSVAKTLRFINAEAKSVHGSLRASSIFTSESGEWKLGGFDVLSSMNEDDAVIYNYGSLVPDSNRYAPPEIGQSGWEVIKRHPITAVDSYDFGILILEVFNGGFHGADQIGQTKNIPPSMHQSYKRLVSANPKARLSAGQFLDQGLRHGGFFQTPLIQLTEGVENLGLKNDAERDEFLGRLEELSDDFPEEFFKMKVLPELLKSVEFGGGGPQVFGMVMKISNRLTDEEYDSQITPLIVRLFLSPDRAIRVCLLDNLPVMIDHLPHKLVNDKIFPQMVTGFTDVAPIVREQTVKAVLTVVPKLSERTVNGELLRYLAKTANDEQPGIRTNTTICLGKIARNLGSSSRTKVLTAAFARALRDPFVHARSASLLALAATLDLFSDEDCATKILPGICPALLDKEKIVREQANKTMELYLGRVRKHGQTMPDSVLPPPTSSDPSQRITTAQQGTSWAGWAISSFTNKLSAASGDIRPTSPSARVMSTNGRNTPSEPQERSLSVPPGGETGSFNQGHLSIGRPGIKKSSSSANPFSSAGDGGALSSLASAEVEDMADDFGVEWGDEDLGGWGGDGVAAADDYHDDQSDSSNPFATSTARKPPAVKINNYDDNGEPDFAGWLAAQSQAKQKAKNPLTKGLAKNTKTSAATKTPSSAATTGTARKSVVTGKPKPAPAKKVQDVPKAEEEDDDWGDAWG